MAIGAKDLIQVGSRIYYLDSRCVDSANVSGVYLVIGDGITLIETATSLIAPHILEAAVAIGFDPEEIRRAIVTHVHLDHAGGTGWLVKHLPHLQVHVHERGLEHLHAVGNPVTLEVGRAGRPCYSQWPEPPVNRRGWQPPSGLSSFAHIPGRRIRCDGSFCLPSW